MYRTFKNQMKLNYQLNRLILGNPQIVLTQIFILIQWIYNILNITNFDMTHKYRKNCLILLSGTILNTSYTRKEIIYQCRENLMSNHIHRRNTI